MGRRGPELTTIGSKRSADWLKEHILNPQAHESQSRMPKFGGKIKDADLQALVDFLASLKE
jgi:cbb3-type cytochrome oxidase cytochrome c subunit